MDLFFNRVPPFLGPPFARDGGGDGDFARGGDGDGDGDFARDGGGDFARDGDGGGDGDFAGPPFACGDADAADDADESLSSSLLS